MLRHYHDSIARNYHSILLLLALSIHSEVFVGWVILCYSIVMGILVYNY